MIVRGDRENIARQCRERLRGLGDARFVKRSSNRGLIDVQTFAKGLSDDGGEFHPILG
jgi:hypothetical protein